MLHASHAWQGGRGRYAVSAPPTEHLARARALARLLDSAAGVPGTRLRFGLDPVLGLVPGLGDAAGAAVSGYLVMIAARAGAPASVIVRMLGNVALDMAVGAVPVVGDLFDFGWKANARNVALVERHLERPAETRAASRAVVAAAVAALALLALAIKAVPVFDQRNLELVAAALPPNLALAWAVRRAARVAPV